MISELNRVGFSQRPPGVAAACCRYRRPDPGPPVPRPLCDPRHHHDHRGPLGGEIATAALAHLAHSTPRGFHFQSSAFHEYHSVKIADGAPVINDGYMVASSAPGLGVTPDMAVLGKPVWVIEG